MGLLLLEPIQLLLQTVSRGSGAPPEPFANAPHQKKKKQKHFSRFLNNKLTMEKHCVQIPERIIFQLLISLLLLPTW